VSIRERFNNLTPGRKKIVVWLVAGAIVLVTIVIGYNTTRSERQEHREGIEKARDITLEPDLIQKTMLREQRKEIDAIQNQLAELKKLRTLPAGDVPTDRGRGPMRKTDMPEIPTADEVAQQAEDRFPAPPFTGPAASRFPPPPSGQPPPPPKEEVVIGTIGRLSNKDASNIIPSAEPDKKKEKRTVYLPPSFMVARLLTGFDASTSGDGKNNPEPLLLRIQAPAVLPNEVKANLRGCFVIAEAVGRLNKERADVRLVSLSCIGAKGEAVIDTTIKGFVTDSDSKVGLAGRVVSKMGAATARAVVAGIFGGAGNALQATAMTQSTSPLGTTTVVDTDQITKSAVGGGLAEGAKTLHELYLDLAKQATPVIEVGATKKVTVVISEGKELEIKQYENESL
jgi:conjugal transfer pilus assembly protein TraB